MTLQKSGDGPQALQAQPGFFGHSPQQGLSHFGFELEAVVLCNAGAGTAEIRLDGTAVIGPLSGINTKGRGTTFLRRYAASARVRDWLAFRHDWLYSPFATRERVEPGIRKHFGSQ